MDMENAKTLAEAASVTRVPTLTCFKKRALVGIVHGKTNVNDYKILFEQMMMFSVDSS